MGQQQWVDIALPRTINTDCGPLRTSEDEAADLYNVLTHEPGQIRQRRGWSGVSKLQSVGVNGDCPANIICAPNLAVGASNPTLINSRATIPLFHNQSGFTPMYRMTFPNGPYPTGYSEITSTQVTSAFLNADNPASVSIAATTGIYSGLTVSLPYGQLTNFDNSIFGTSIGRYNSNWKTGGSGLGARLVRWGGQNRALTTVNATVNNGSTSVTLASTVTPSLAGTFMRFNSEPVGKQYNYYVLAHVAGTSAVTLMKAYGLGDATIPNKVAASASFSSWTEVAMSPPDVQCCIAYMNRLFVGRPTLLTSVGTVLSGTYPNGVAWSDVSEPEKWTDTNFALLDSNLLDPVMGFATLSYALVIFRRWSTWIMTGTDETTFTFRKVSGEIGCLHSDAIAPYRDGVFFMSDSGMYYYDGYQFQNMTGDGQKGILETYRSDANLWTYDSPLVHQMLSIIPRTDYLIMAVTDQSQSPITPNDFYMLHVPTGAWTRHSCQSSIKGPEVITKPGQHLNNRIVAVSGEAVIQLDRMVQEESNFGTGSAARSDQSYSISTGSPTSAFVLSQVKLSDLRLFQGSQGRVHRLMFEHAIFTDVAGTGLTGYNVTMLGDPSFDKGSPIPSAGQITPRYEVGASSLAPINYRYSTELAGSTWPIIGTTFRLQFDTVNTPPATASYPPKILGIRALVESIDTPMVDNPVLS